jgi:hypothetical protein
VPYLRAEEVLLGWGWIEGGVIIRSGSMFFLEREDNHHEDAFRVCLARAYIYKCTTKIIFSVHFSNINTLKCTCLCQFCFGSILRIYIFVDIKNVLYKLKV